VEGGINERKDEWTKEKKVRLSQESLESLVFYLEKMAIDEIGRN